jgi:hypothetical protein
VKIYNSIYTEEYCCLAGYLGLCKARGETAVGMAEAAKVSPQTIWHHLRREKQGLVKCKGRSDCMLPIIEDVKKAP